jgi:hypothetical protein
MYYVCEYANDRPLQFLAGPYETEEQAIAASGAYEADHPDYRMKTFVWTCRAGLERFIRRVDSAADSPISLPFAQSPTIAPSCTMS